MSFCNGATLAVNTKDTLTLLDDDKFTALEALVEIIPKFSSDKPVDCIKGKFGPFRAHSAAKVPLWLALEMDRLQQCTIELPAWLHEEELKRMRDDELANPETFGNVPEHYLEIAFAFLTESHTYKHDNRDKSRTVLLLRDLVELRRSKIVDGLKQLDVSSEMNVTHMSAAELTCFRTRSLHTLDMFYSLLTNQMMVGQELQSSAEAQPTPQEDSSSGLLPPL
mmetsp:Transcript_36274/g.63906  ORF Transcript_36274/g.63906 Transcript_36274/m.63906 type:complete len:223 (-) Transcript_36274:33-701(-)